MTKHDPAHAGHVALADGRWLDLRPMYISELKAVIAWQERDEQGTFIEQVDEIVALIEPAVRARSWDGSFEDMSPDELFKLIGRWRTVTEDDALPPENGTDSATK